MTCIDAEHDMTTEVDEDDEECVDDQIFHPKKKMFCSKDVEAQRVFQVCVTIYGITSTIWSWLQGTNWFISAFQMHFKFLGHSCFAYNFICGEKMCYWQALKYSEQVSLVGIEPRTPAHWAVLIETCMAEWLVCLTHIPNILSLNPAWPLRCGLEQGSLLVLLQSAQLQ